VQPASIERLIGVNVSHPTGEALIEQYPFNAGRLFTYRSGEDDIIDSRVEEVSSNVVNLGGQPRILTPTTGRDRSTRAGAYRISRFDQAVDGE
jgi:hypothetical protein